MKTAPSSRARLSILFSMLIWGSIGLFRRFIPLPSASLAAVRALGGVACLMAWTFLRRQPIAFSALRKNALALLLSGAFIGANWILLFEAYRYTSVAVATLCYYMAPMIVMLLSPFMLHERLTKKKLLCLAASLLGMTMVSGVLCSNDGNSLRGVLLGLAAAMFYASVILTNKRISGISSMDRTVAQLSVAAVVAIPYALLTEDLSAVTLNPNSIIMLLIVMIVHTGLAYALYFSSMDLLPAQTAALMSYIDPISAILLSALVLKEGMNLLSIVGTVLVLSSVICCELPEKKSARTN